MIKFRIAAFRAEPLVIEATDDDADRFAMSAVCREHRPSLLRFAFGRRNWPPVATLATAPPEEHVSTVDRVFDSDETRHVAFRALLRKH